MADMAVSFAGISFKNPVVTVSGTFGFGREYGEMYDLAELGGVCAKGLTLRPRLGNRPPRVAETPSGMLNSVGLQNPGVDAFISEELPYLKASGTRVIANISGGAPDEYAAAAKKLSSAGVDMIEINISCPNVKAGGIAFGTDCSAAAEVTSAVKSVSEVPVMVKLSPNVTDITAIATAVADAGADALSLINTLIGMRINIETRHPILANNTGGLSGPAVFPVAVRMVSQVRAAVDLPILGMGGIASGEDAVEMMLAGADLVGVGTACFTDPFAPIKIRDGIEGYLDRKGIRSAAEISGKVILN